MVLPALPARVATSATRLLAVSTVLMLTGCTSPTPDRPVETRSPAPTRKLITPETLLGMPKTKSRPLHNAAKAQIDRLKGEVTNPTSAAGQAYGGNTPEEDALVMSGASGTVSDQSATLGRALSPYRISDVKTVDAGQLGGVARCGAGRAEDGSYLTACGWADNESVGVIVFISSKPQGDLTAKFLDARSELEKPAG